MARKTEVYSWRLAPALKASLEEAVRRDRKTIAQLLEEAVISHLAQGQGASDPETQRRLHDQAERFAGCIRGEDPRRSSRARILVRQRLRRLRRGR